MHWLNGILIAIGCIVAAMVVATVARRYSLRRYRQRMRVARELFYRRREWLEARFVTHASKSGKPRGLRWLNVDFDDDVTFARDKQSGDLRALVGVTISFEAVEGGDMEEVEAVGNLRAATAVFLYAKQQWETYD